MEQIKPDHCTEVRFASFFSGGFITMAVINPPESKLAKRTSVHCDRYQNNHNKNATEWHWFHTSEICGLSTIINFTPKKYKIRKIGYFQLA